MVTTTLAFRVRASKRLQFFSSHRNAITSSSNGAGPLPPNPGLTTAASLLTRRSISSSNSNNTTCNIGINSSIMSDGLLGAGFFSNLNRRHYVEDMDWSSYFALRGTRRLYERVLMIPSGLLGLFGGGYYFVHQEFDPTASFFGMDQIIVYGLGTIASGVLGLALGPVVGNVIFRSVHAHARPLVDQMDREFLKRIVENRANPTGNPLTNPIPDFYGEKIKSVTDYRTWLRKQREYQRKTTFFV